MLCSDEWSRKESFTNMFLTVTGVCSELVERIKSLALARQVATMNGYTSCISNSRREILRKVAIPRAYITYPCVCSSTPMT